MVQIYWRELKADVREHAHARHHWGLENVLLHDAWILFSFLKTGLKHGTTVMPILWSEHQSLLPQIHADLSS